jgi:hypothetical protein
VTAIFDGTVEEEDSAHGTVIWQTDDCNGSIPIIRRDGSNDRD